MSTTGERFERAVQIMARLRAPGGCPWDREQTFDTIKPYTLEETYEVLEAIDNRDWPELTGELGDLLLQVLFYSQMASEEGHFSVDDVLDRLSNKLVDRHPHVFGEVKADTPAEVLRNWEALKAQEKEEAAGGGRRHEGTADWRHAPAPCKRRKERGTPLTIRNRCSRACPRKCLRFSKRINSARARRMWDSTGRRLKVCLQSSKKKLRSCARN